MEPTEMVQEVAVSDDVVLDTLEQLAREEPIVQLDSDIGEAAEELKAEAFLSREVEGDQEDAN
jgi:hypothetical protein